MNDEPLAKGQVFDAPSFNARVTVKRVARDLSWADIYVQTPFHHWTKRQPLSDGWFAYPVSRLA